MAIIPYRPFLHAVLIKLWAESQYPVNTDEVDHPLALQLSPEVEEPDVIQEVSLQLTAPSQSDSHLQQSARAMILPMVVSSNNPRAFLEDSSCRRSTRQSVNRKGFRHIQLEDHPRKEALHMD